MQNCLKFTKMHGLGNDYIYFNCLNEEIAEPEKLAIKLSHRNFGIGGDGIILIMRSKIADFRMRMFNADGSEGKMCGNGTRCIAKYVYEKKLIDKTDFTLETLGGIKKIHLTVDGEKVVGITIDMGVADFSCKSIPVIFNGDALINEPITVSGKETVATCVSMGNPHCVIFTENIDALDLNKIGPDYENSPMFPERTNTEFVEVIDGRHLRMRVWERGSGETMACGTGACAVVAAAVKTGLCKINDDITVSLLGGDLVIRCLDDYTIMMTGTASFVFEGEICEELLK